MSSQTSAVPPPPSQPPAGQPPASPENKPKPSLIDNLTSITLMVLVLAAVVLSIIVLWGKGTPMDRLKLATGYASLIFLFFLSIVVLLDIIRNKINLSEMLEELSGGASMSRFQLLVFTFMFAFSFFFIASSQGKFPDIPNNVLALLGVSASTYAVSKGLQVGSGSVEPTDSSTGNSTDKNNTQPQP